MHFLTSCRRVGWRAVAATPRPSEPRRALETRLCPCRLWFCADLVTGLGHVGVCGPGAPEGAGRASAGSAPASGSREGRGEDAGPQILPGAPAGAPARRLSYCLGGRPSWGLQRVTCKMAAPSGAAAGPPAVPRERPGAGMGSGREHLRWRHSASLRRAVGAPQPGCRLCRAGSSGPGSAALRLTRVLREVFLASCSPQSPSGQSGDVRERKEGSVDGRRSRPRGPEGERPELEDRGEGRAQWGDSARETRPVGRTRAGWSGLPWSRAP